jgi:hypothetical protein
MAYDTKHCFARARKRKAAAGLPHSKILPGSDFSRRVKFVQKKLKKIERKFRGFRRRAESSK